MGHGQVIHENRLENEKSRQKRYEFMENHRNNAKKNQSPKKNLEGENLKVLKVILGGQIE